MRNPAARKVCASARKSFTLNLISISRCMKKSVLRTRSPRRGSGNVEARRANFFLPVHRFDWAHCKYPAQRSNPGNHGGNHDGPVELAGTTQEISGKHRSDRAGEVADEILQSGPAAGDVCPCDRLRYGPTIVTAHSEEDAG